eukprot:m.244638 g.244638  ORF g.244638 m.244638 type:complete len:78 (-) comp19474_c0_seq3:1666-1899(-)
MLVCVCADGAPRRRLCLYIWQDFLVQNARCVLRINSRQLSSRSLLLIAGNTTTRPLAPTEMPSLFQSSRSSFNSRRS